VVDEFVADLRAAVVAHEGAEHAGVSAKAARYGDDVSAEVGGG
jgi:hypothetical protein